MAFGRTLLLIIKNVADHEICHQKSEMLLIMENVANDLKGSHLVNKAGYTASDALKHLYKRVDEKV